MKPLTQIQLLLVSVGALLTAILVLHSLSTTTIDLLLHHLSQNLILFSITWCFSISLFFYLISCRRRPVLLLDYSCYQPDFERKCGYEVCEYFVERSGRFNITSGEFMRKIYLRSGLGDETYAPPFIFQTDYEAKYESAVQEAEEGMFASVDNLLSKTEIDPSRIDIVIANCGMFAPTPSLSSRLVNRYKLRSDIKTFSVSSMGCGAGAVMMDMAARFLNSSRAVRYILVTTTESMSLNWYFGDNRPMLVTNCIFRAGCAAIMVTNDPARRSSAKMELRRSLRTHHGADDASYNAVMQEEDVDGNLGVALTKDLIRVAGEALQEHIKSLAPYVLPIGELLAYARSLLMCTISKGKAQPMVPDFTKAFEHICVHNGGKAIIQQVERQLNFKGDIMEPARMSLHRFGNTSSSLLFYELAYYEAKGRIKKGDKMWMLAFGTGFKVCSLVWKALKDSSHDSDNPWSDCIHRFPVNAY